MSAMAPGKLAYLETVRAMMRTLEAPRRVVEAGVGAGGTARKIMEMLTASDELIAVDLDQGNLDALLSAASENTPKIRVVRGDARGLAELIDAPVDAVCSDTMLNMLGMEFPRWFSAAHRVLRPGGALIFREIQPPDSPAKTRRDFFLHALEAARAASGDAARFVPPEAAAATLDALGFREIACGYSAPPDGLGFNLEQWHPLSRRDCPLRAELIAWFERVSHGCDAGPAISASYHMSCRK